MKLFTVTNTELRKKNPSEFGKKATIDIYDTKSGKLKYIINLIFSEKFKDSNDQYGWKSTVEDGETYKILDCTPGIERPYYIDDFLNRN